MATPNTFGVTPTELQEVVTNLTITSSTSPSTAEVQNLIEYAAAELDLEGEATGINLQGLSDPTDRMYLLYKRALIYRAVADVLTAKNRGNPEAGLYYMGLHDKLLDNIRKHPDRVAARSANQGPERLKYLDYDDIQDNERFVASTLGKLVIGNSL